VGKADAWGVREVHGPDVAQVVRENPYRPADEIHDIGLSTADSLRVMLGIGTTLPLRLQAALKYVLSLVARTEGHAYLPLAELIDRTARHLGVSRSSGTTARDDACQWFGSQRFTDAEHTSQCHIVAIACACPSS
jgi:exodeoxyribonuclease V alpha subunit